MKFSRLLKSKVIPEWSDFYLNYKLLKSIIGPFKIMDKCTSNLLNSSLVSLKADIDNDQICICNFEATDKENMKTFLKKFDDLLLKEFDKVISHNN